jgi:hypothetical protein
MQGSRSKTRIVIAALVIAILLYVCATALRRSMAREALEARLHETRATLNSADAAATDSPAQQEVRRQLSDVLARTTVDSLDRPSIAAAVVPQYTKELTVHWIAKEPDAVDAVQVQVDAGTPVKLALPAPEIESNRVDARSRVLYTNTLKSPDIERVLTAAPPGARLGVVLLSNGAPVSEPAAATLGTGPLIRGEKLKPPGAATTAPSP